MKEIIKVISLSVLGLLISISFTYAKELDVPPDDYQPPAKMDEETAKDFARYTLYRFPLDNPNELEWDELQVKLYPFYDIYGNNKSYLAIVYLGTGKMPNDEAIKKSTAEGYATYLRIKEFERKGERPPSELMNKFMMSQGNDSNGDCLYISTIFSEATSGDFVRIGGAEQGLPRLFTNEPSVIRAVEEYTGKKAEVTGYFGCKHTGYGFEVLSGGRYYYVRGHFESWLDEQIMTKEQRESVFDKKYKEFKKSNEIWQHSIDTFRRILYEIEINPEIIDGTYKGE